MAGLGDWLFRSLAFPDAPDDADAYFARHAARVGLDEVAIDALMAKREGLGAFLEELIDRYELDRCELAGFTTMFSQSVASFAMAASSLRIDDLRGIARQMPWTFAAFVVAGLSLIGIPGTAGFISKWFLISAAMDLGPIGLPLVGVILISSLMAVVYVWRIVEAACFGTAPGDASSAPGRRVSPVLVAVAWVAALSNIYFGLVPELPLTLSRDAAVELLRHLP